MYNYQRILHVCSVRVAAPHPPIINSINTCCRPHPIFLSGTSVETVLIQVTLVVERNDKKL